MAANEEGLNPSFWNPAAGSMTAFSKQRFSVRKLGAGHLLPASHLQNLYVQTFLYVQQVYFKSGVESTGTPEPNRFRLEFDGLDSEFPILNVSRASLEPIRRCFFARFDACSREVLTDGRFRGQGSVTLDPRRYNTR